MPRYKTIIFDCDGVLLDSNHIKEDAFYSIGLNFFGPEAAAFIRDYHRTNGGVSRYEKFRLLLEKWPAKATLERLLVEFAARIHDALLTCPEAEGLRTVLSNLKKRSFRMFIVSGADEKELRGLMDKRGLSDFFDGIFGSPFTKTQIIQELAAKAAMITPVVFVGDSKTDFDAAQSAGIDFVFSKEFSKVNPEYFGLAIDSMSCVRRLMDILEFVEIK